MHFDFKGISMAVNLQGPHKHQGTNNSSSFGVPVTEQALRPQSIIFETLQFL